ncbi:MAG: DUF5908 family protein [Bacteroidia bacterium]
MPIEIRELVIRAEVNPQNGGGNRSDDFSQQREAMVKAAVEASVSEVMRILKEKKDR